MLSLCRKSTNSPHLSPHLIWTLRWAFSLFFRVIASATSPAYQPTVRNNAYALLKIYDPLVLSFW